MLNLKIFLFFLAVLTITGINCQQAHINVYDGFESPGLSEIWVLKEWNFVPLRFNQR